MIFQSRFLVLLLFAFFSLGLASSSANPVSPGSSTIESAPTLHITLGADGNVCGITPLAVKPKRKIGLIVWLHGGMRSQNREKGAEAHRALLPFVNLSDYYLCSPSAFAGEDWLTSKGLGHIESLIDYMIGHYPIDIANINLVGVSDGSLGVIAYSMGGKRNLHRRVLISCYPQIVVSPDSLAGHREFATGTWDFFQGGRDRLFPSQQVLPFLETWKSVYPNTRLHYFPVGEHDFSFYATNASEELKGIFTGK